MSNTLQVPNGITYGSIYGSRSNSIYGSNNGSIYGSRNGSVYGSRNRSLSCSHSSLPETPFSETYGRTEESEKLYDENYSNYGLISTSETYGAVGDNLSNEKDKTKSSKIDIVVSDEFTQSSSNYCSMDVNYVSEGQYCHPDNGNNFETTNPSSYVYMKSLPNVKTNKYHETKGLKTNVQSVTLPWNCSSQIATPLPYPDFSKPTRSSHCSANTRDSHNSDSTSGSQHAAEREDKISACSSQGIALSNGYVPLMDLWNQSWFNMELGLQDSEDLLRQKGKDGSFVVRNSSNKDGRNFTLSFYVRKLPNNVRHLRITFIPETNEWKLGCHMETKFSKVTDCVEYYWKKGFVLEDGSHVKLTKPLKMRKSSEVNINPRRHRLLSLF